MVMKFVADINWRKSVISLANEYVNYVWTPTEKKRYHGYDREGIAVNTPDYGYESTSYHCGWWQVNQKNKGIPYNWGGCSSLQDFGKGIMEGKFAGNVPELRSNGSSRECVGVDCSGLVTVCWNTKIRVTTGMIPDIAVPLEVTDILLPGDLLLLPESHVMIFSNFTDETKTRAQIIDATRSTGKVSIRTAEILDLTNKGYAAYRRIL